MCLSKDRRDNILHSLSGKVLALLGLSSSSLLSPVYAKSTVHSHRCFKFRYLIQGAGVQSLEVRLSTANLTFPQMIWVDKENTNPGWRYGQVPVTALNPIQARTYCQIFVVVMRPWS